MLLTTYEDRPGKTRLKRHRYEDSKAETLCTRPINEPPMQGPNGPEPANPDAVDNCGACKSIESGRISRIYEPIHNGGHIKHFYQLGSEHTLANESLATIKNPATKGTKPPAGTETGVEYCKTCRIALRAVAGD